MHTTRRSAIGLLVTALLLTGVAGTALAARPTSRICEQSAPDSGRFVDVPAGYVHAVGIYCIATAGITLGRTPETFDPYASVSRGQMAAFLRRMMQASIKPVPDSPQDWFDDDARNLHEDHINALASVGILPAGTRTFRPDDPIQRDEMAAWMNGTWRWITGGGADEGSVPFEDVGQNPHLSDIKAMFRNGITDGTTATTYGPADPVTRGQMGSFLARLLAMHADAGHLLGIAPGSTTTTDPVPTTSLASTTTTQPAPDPFDALSPAAQAIVRQSAAAHGGVVRWSSSPIKVAATGAWSPGALSQSVTFWNDVLGGLGVSMVQVTDPGAADVVFTIRPDRPAGVPSTACGVEGPTSDGIVNHVIIKGHGEYWPDDPPCDRTGSDHAVWDRVAITHGLGHVLGLMTHTPSGSDVMGTPNAAEGTSPLLDEVMGYLYSVAPGTQPGG